MESYNSDCFKTENLYDRTEGGFRKFDIKNIKLAQVHNNFSEKAARNGDHQTRKERLS